jgi:hypothetical protein
MSRSLIVVNSAFGRGASSSMAEHSACGRKAVL